MKLLRAALLLAALVAFLLLALPPEEHKWRISDPTGVQERRLADWFHSFSSGLLAIRVVGNLSEPADVETPLGTIRLPGGPFDFIALADESWSSSAVLRYASSATNRGEVQISVSFGARPDWARFPPASALPVFYTGGWTAYHEGTERKAWRGGFRSGKKNGEFLFWNAAGEVIQRETWADGSKSNGL